MKTANWILAAVTSGSIAIGSASAQGDVKDLNAIIRSLAPIEYLPEHSGKPARPSIDLDIQFEINKATLLPQAVTQLRELGQALQSNALRNKTIEIAGHTDATGSASYNKKLSLRRARSVADYLTREYTIDPKRLTVVGHGEDRLKEPLQPASAVNRRVEIITTGVVAGNKPSRQRATGPQSAAREEENGAGTWSNLLEDSNGAQQLLQRAEAEGELRVIVGLAAPQQESAQSQGWRNLNDYIRDLQEQAIDKLGWTNINELVRYEFTPAMAMSVDAAQLQQLLEGDVVAQVFEDQLHSPSLSKSVPLIGLPSGRSGGGVAGHAVAVLDTGVDASHPFLKGKVIAEVCFSSNKQRRGAVIRSACPSGDLMQIGPGAARPCDPAYGCAHGTHVAGIVAGQNNEMRGVAAQSSIVAIQVFSLVQTPRGRKDTGAFTSDILRALEWIYRNRDRYKIASVNLSLGGGRFMGVCDRRSPYTRIFALLEQSDIASVVASGNNGHANAVSSPACISHTISVGATSYRDKVAKFSNSAGFLDFLAPGATEHKYGNRKGILSAVPGTGFRRMQGTSMAAAHVAGAFAVLKSIVPNASLWQMTRALRDTGQNITDPRNGIATPRIRLDRAIAVLKRNIAREQPRPPPDAKPKPEPTPVVQPKPEPKPKPVPVIAPQPKPKVYDGIRVYEDGKSKDKPFKW